MKNSTGFIGFIKKWFGIEENQTSIKNEVIGGVVTFLSMAYILFVNPDMLVQLSGDTGPSFGAIFAATALAGALTTILMGIYARLPIALAPGMGLNAFFVYNVGFAMGFDYFQALGIVFISGILFLILSLTGVRSMLISAIPKSMKLAMGAGIGLFIAFIGLIGAGFVIPAAGTPLAIGDFSQPTVLLAAFGILLAIVLHVKKVTGGILIAMVVTAITGGIFNELLYNGSHAWLNFGQIIKDGEIVDSVDWIASLPAFSKDAFNDFTPQFGEMFEIPGKMFGAMGSIFSADAGKAIAAILIFLFVDFFDTAGTIVAVGKEAGIVDEDGNMEGAEKALMCDAIGTVAGSMIGTSTVTAFVESGSGVAAGAKTGLASVVTGLCFIVALFTFPFIFPLVTAQVTSLALIMVGILMFTQLRYIDWEDNAITISAFFMVALMPLTYAIYWGITTAFIAYAVVMLVTGRQKEVSTPMWVMSALSVVFFILEFVAIK